MFISFILVGKKVDVDVIKIIKERIFMKMLKFVGFALVLMVSASLSAQEAIIEEQAPKVAQADAAQVVVPVVQETEQKETEKKDAVSGVEQDASGAVAAQNEQEVTSEEVQDAKADEQLEDLFKQLSEEHMQKEEQKEQEQKTEENVGAVA